MEITSDIIIADLESKYKKIKEEKDTSIFFLKVADYGKYLIENQNFLKEIEKSLIEDSRKDSKSFNKSFVEFLDLWRYSVKDLLHLIEDFGIDEGLSPSFQKNIERIKELLKNKNIEPVFGDVNSFYSPYVKALEEAKSVNGFSENTSFDSYQMELMTLYTNADNEWRKLEKIRSISSWWAHFNILRLSLGVFKLSGVEKFLSPNRVLDGIYKYEFEQISRGDTQDIVILKEYEFKEWIDILHNYLIPRIRIISNDKKESNQVTNINSLKTEPIPKSWILIEENNKLNITKNKKVIYTFPRKDSNKCKYFKKIWERDGKIVMFDELYKAIGLNYPYKKGENNRVNKLIRDTLRKLNKEFEKQNVSIRLVEKDGYRISFS